MNAVRSPVRLIASTMRNICTVSDPEDVICLLHSLPGPNSNVLFQWEGCIAVPEQTFTALKISGKTGLIEKLVLAQKTRGINDVKVVIQTPPMEAIYGYAIILTCVKLLKTIENHPVHDDILSIIGQIIVAFGADIYPKPNTGNDYIEVYPQGKSVTAKQIKLNSQLRDAQSLQVNAPSKYFVAQAASLLALQGVNPDKCIINPTLTKPISSMVAKITRAENALALPVGLRKIIQALAALEFYALAQEARRHYIASLMLQDHANNAALPVIVCE